MTADPAEATPPTPVPIPGIVDDGGVPLVDFGETPATFPFRVAYQLRGERKVDEFQALVSPPFAVFRRFSDLDRAADSDQPKPDDINRAIRGLLATALPWDDFQRLMLLIDGDADVVGVINPQMIGGIVDVLRSRYYNVTLVPTPPRSSSGRSTAGAGSKARRSATASKTPSRSRSKTASR